MFNPERYLGMDPDSLTIRYVEVCAMLASMYIQLHDATIAERKAHEHAFWTSTGTSIAAKNRDADAAAIDMWIAMKDVEAAVADAQEERDMLLHLIEWRRDAGRN